MIFPDYHLHSDFSADCVTNINDIIKSAKDKALSSICITDHYDMDFPVLPENPDIRFELDYQHYYPTLSELRNSLLPDFDLRIGIELGITAENISHVTEFAKSHKEYDFFIASSHLVDNMDPYYPSYFEEKTEIEAYRRYFETILFNVTHFKDYNVYGHLDYILRYGPNKANNFSIKDYQDIFEEIFKIMVYDGKGIEINTGSLYKNMAFPHPHADILKLYKAAGGEIITVGSDAHFPEHIGYGFDVARTILLEQGFKYYTTFSLQKPTFIPIVQIMIIFQKKCGRYYSSTFF